MRIVGGTYRGGSLASPKAGFVRPTTDKVKEAVFNILSARIRGARFLDLFGGSGGMGIEAISRGATATFADSSRESYRLIESNLAKFRLKADVLYADYKVALKRLAADGARFDIIFLDPPYATDYDVRAVELVDEYGLLAEGGVVVVEHRGKENLIGKSSFALLDERRYGSCHIAILGRESDEQE